MYIFFVGPGHVVVHTHCQKGKHPEKCVEFHPQCHQNAQGHQESEEHRHEPRGGEIHPILYAVRASQDEHGVEEHEDISYGAILI